MSAIKIKRLHHIQICIPAGFEDDARRFYTDILGFPEIEKPKVLKPNGGLWYKMGESEMHIGIEPEIYPSKRHPAFEVEDIAGVRKFLEANNISYQEEKPLPGQQRISFLDPWKNKIELLERA
jgi:catechol 2,3-dioxygenase-like lactoylglutathione lyase family enzyme